MLQSITLSVLHRSKNLEQPTLFRSIEGNTNELLGFWRLSLVIMNASQSII